MFGLGGHRPLRTGAGFPSIGVLPSMDALAVVDGEAAWLQAILQRWRERALAAEARLAAERGVSLDQAADACVEALWRDGLTSGRLPTQVVADTLLALKTAPGEAPGRN